jgi:succinate dehydrogenase flavin-adding protein (antitoxin of CptAB toxin-antitoxin module)
MKRTSNYEENEEEELEVFTQEPISTISRKNLIKIGTKYYSLPQLYNWIVNYDKTKDPLTNELFDEIDIKKVKTEGILKYPLNVKLLKLMSASNEINTSALMSINSLCREILKAETGQKSSTDFEFLIEFLNSGINFTMNKKTALDLLLENDEKQIFEIFEDTNILSAYVQNYNTPPSALIKAKKSREFAILKGFPTDKFDAKIYSLEKLLNK